MANEVTRDEYNVAIQELRKERIDAINRIFDKMDAHQRDLSENMTRIAMDMAQMRTKISNLRVPVQPCETLKEHITDHKKFWASWRTPLIVGIVVTVFLFIQEPIKNGLAELFK